MRTERGGPRNEPKRELADRGTWPTDNAAARGLRARDGASGIAIGAF